MSSYVRTLLDKDRNQILPRTSSEAVVLPNGINLDDKLSTFINYDNSEVSPAIQIDMDTFNGHAPDYFVAKDELYDSFYRQAIINGNFDIWQRGTSQTKSGYASDDRWTNMSTGSTKTHSRQSFDIGQTEVPNNPTYFSRTEVTSVAGDGNYVVKSQRIEDVTKLAGKTITLSFWAKADAPKNIAIEYAQAFGTGGSAAIFGISTKKIALTTTWQKFTYTTTLPGISGMTVGAGSSTQVHFWFDAGTSNDYRTDTLGQQSGVFDIAQVQINEGDIALPFLTRAYVEELMLCQRYYEKSYNDDTVPGTTTQGAGIEIIGFASNTLPSAIIYGSVTFRVEKRIAPSVTIYPYTMPSATGIVSDGYGSNLAANTGYVEFSGKRAFMIRNNTGATVTTNRNSIIFHWTADAEI